MTNPCLHAPTRPLVDEVVTRHPEIGHVQTLHPEGTGHGAVVVYNFGHGGRISGPADLPSTYTRALAKACSLLYGYDRLSKSDPVRVCAEHLLVADPCRVAVFLTGVWSLMTSTARHDLIRLLDPYADTDTRQKVIAVVEHAARVSRTLDLPSAPCRKS